VVRGPLTEGREKKKSEKRRDKLNRDGVTNQNHSKLPGGEKVGRVLKKIGKDKPKTKDGGRGSMGTQPKHTTKNNLVTRICTWALKGPVREMTT